MKYIIDYVGVALYLDEKIKILDEIHCSDLCEFSRMKSKDKFYCSLFSDELNFNDEVSDLKRCKNCLKFIKTKIV